MIAIILAAGKSTRMKSDLPKVLHRLCGRPMILYLINLAKNLGIKDIYVVVGHKNELLTDLLKDQAKIVLQKRLLGTADAVNAARQFIEDKDDDVLVLYGDTPLLTDQTLKKLVDIHKRSNNSCTFLTAILKNPTGYGRVVCNDNDKIIKIIEENSASIYEKVIEEVNVGTYCFKSKDLFKGIEKIKPNTQKGEYYLTDIISIFSKENKSLEAVKVLDADEMIGINSRVDLAKAASIINQRNLTRLMNEGVTIIDPNNTYIDEAVTIGQDTIIYPFTIIERDASIGKECSIGPFVRIRGNTVIKDGAIIGNFVEVVRSIIGENSRVKHHTYLGDTVVGKDVNIGAGTIVANFDGKSKNKTYVEDGAFIGSGTVLVAPIRVGKHAVTGAGCVVTKNKDVPDNSVVVGVPARPLKRSNKNGR